MESDDSGGNEELESTLEQDDDMSDDDEESEQQESEDAEGTVSEEEAEYSMDISNFNKQSDSTIKTMSDTNVRAEIEKGNCIRNQLKTWENLSEMRIKLQKCVVTSNQMPQYDTHKEFRSDEEFIKKVNDAKAKLMLLVSNMLQLRDLLLKQYPETRNLCVGSEKRKADDEEDKNTDDPMDEEISSDTEDELENKEETFTDKDAETAKKPRKRLKYNECEKVLQENHDLYKKYRDSVIKKWNDKTRIATGALNKSSGQSTLKQIEFAMSDISKLRKRTQLKRSEYNIVGKSTMEDNDGRRIQEYDPEIYDDNDFYHQLLKDLIEYKSSDVTDPIQLSKQMIRLQNMRTKMKRKIDTRATKGRRVRYNVHTKLVNFMAPITVYDTWTDSAKNELYSSLFGKIKSTEEQIKYL
ncbi:protein AATF-like isoform X2 [Linepithema humile]